MRDCKRDPTTPACSCGCLQPQTRTTWGARTCPARCDPTAAPRARGESRDGPRPLLLHPLPRPPGPHPPARAAGTVPGLREPSLPAGSPWKRAPRSGAAARRPLPAPPSPLETSPQAPALRSGAPSGCWRRPRCPEAPYPPRERSASRISARRGPSGGGGDAVWTTNVSMAGDADQGEGSCSTRTRTSGSSHPRTRPCGCCADGSNPPSGPTPCQTNTPARGGLPRLNEWALGRGGAAGLGGAGRGWAWGRGHPNGG